MKRWFDSSPLQRSKSSEAVWPVPEPSSKKQKSSNIKQSVKRIFGSVKRLLPSQRRREKQQQIQEKSFAQPIPQTEQDFLTNLAPEWTIEQAQVRIDYLYKLVNDAFERTYQNVLKGEVPISTHRGAIEYMTELRFLQSIVKQRAEQFKLQSKSMERSKETLEPEYTKSKSIEIEVTEPICNQQVFYSPPFAPIERNIEEGMKCGDVTNCPFLERYNLSRSKAQLPVIEDLTRVSSCELMETLSDEFQQTYAADVLSPLQEVQTGLQLTPTISGDSFEYIEKPQQLHSFHELHRQKSEDLVCRALTVGKSLDQIARPIDNAPPDRSFSVKELINRFEANLIF